MGNTHILGIFGRGKVRGTSEPPIPTAPATFPAPREKMEQLHLKALASVLQGFCQPGNYHDMFGSAGRKPFQIPLHFRDSAQRVSKLNPESRIRPNPFIFPAISHYFPFPNPSFKHQRAVLKSSSAKKERADSPRAVKKPFRRYPFSGSGGAIIPPPSPSGLATAASASVEGAAAPVLRLNSSGSVGVNSPRTIL